MNIEYLKYFSELAKIQHYGKGGKGAEYFTAGAQPCNQIVRRRVWGSAFSEGRAECEPQPLRQRTDEGCG